VDSPFEGGGTSNGDGTRVVHAGLPEPVPGAPFLPGPVFAATYHLPHAGVDAALDTYGRPDNPTRRRLESAIGSLEGGDCLVFGSGLAAISAVLLTVLRPGDRLLLPSDGYYSLRAFAAASLAPLGVSTTTAPTAGPYPALAGLKLVVLESPANPSLDVCDIAALAAAAHAAGALLAVDNTTATPLGQRPLDLGADISMASGTKALTGHSDVLLGYVATRSPEIMAGLVDWRKNTGGIPGAFDCWLAHRSLATLDLRLARHAQNAAELARLLAARPGVTNVRWPGRPSDPGHEIAARQMRRYPGIVGFTLPSAVHVQRFLDAARLVFAATSFGGVHTTADRRHQWGDDTAPGFVRLSCGIEDTEDLVADVDQALSAALS
jgi:cystathionine gamma-lyase